MKGGSDTKILLLKRMMNENEVIFSKKLFIIKILFLSKYST